MRRLASALAVFLAACGGRSPLARDPGPPPPPDHQAQVLAVMERLMMEQDYGPATFRFAAPVPDRVARWIFEPEPPPGQGHGFGYVHGWRVDVWYPAPRLQRRDDPFMAFFQGGLLLGIFREQYRPDVPLDLAKWSPWYISPAAALPLPSSPAEVFR